MGFRAPVDPTLKACGTWVPRPGRGEALSYKVFVALPQNPDTREPVRAAEVERSERGARPGGEGAIEGYKTKQRKPQR